MRRFRGGRIRRLDRAADAGVQPDRGHRIMRSGQIAKHRHDLLRHRRQRRVGGGAGRLAGARIGASVTAMASTTMPEADLDDAVEPACQTTRRRRLSAQHDHSPVRPVAQLGRKATSSNTGISATARQAQRRPRLDSARCRHCGAPTRAGEGADKGPIIAFPSPSTSRHEARLHDEDRGQHRPVALRQRRRCSATGRAHTQLSPSSMRAGRYRLVA